MARDAFSHPKGRCFADIQPMTDEFGWPRRNAFIQPQVDAVMLEGLSRFPNVRCLFSRELEAFSQQDDEVTVHLKTAEGQRKRSKPSGWWPVMVGQVLSVAL